MPTLRTYSFANVIVRLCFACMLLVCTHAHAGTVQIPEARSTLLGPDIQFFQEEKAVVPIEEAIDRFDNGDTTQNASDAISLGLGVPAVWIKVSVENTRPDPLHYLLSVETPWLDHIETWVQHDGALVRYIPGGDVLPLDKQPSRHKFYRADIAFEPDLTDLFIRVETLGPMAFSLRLSDYAMTAAADAESNFHYGLLYGLLSGLVIYYVFLFLFARQPEFGLYSAYLMGFMLDNMSYTGILHVWLPLVCGPFWQDWVDSFFMVAYSIAGLHFARYLLDIQKLAPRLDRFVVWATITVSALFALCMVTNQLVGAVIVGFVQNSSFVVLFVLMGVVALRARHRAAILFLIASVTAALCVTISHLAVAGLLPYTTLTYRAIEYGMAFEAIMFAVLLAYQFKSVRLEKYMAEEVARHDHLTQLQNRAGFDNSTSRLWDTIIRKKYDVSILVIDADHFKAINDRFGHNGGDAVLKELAARIQRTVRKGDVLARWGGEEFIIVLPETDRDSAITFADRIVHAVRRFPFYYQGKAIPVTVSIGLTGSQSHTYLDLPLDNVSLQTLIADADAALYEAKEQGRDRVCRFVPAIKGRRATEPTGH